MLPWVYGFEWNAGYLIFLGVFFCVAAIVAGTLVTALWRAWRGMKRGEAPKLQWAEAFHQLPAQDRGCRHAYTGELEGRVCPREFECASCATHAQLVENAPCLVTEGTEEVGGLTFPLDRLYHRGHTWVLPQEDGTVVVGLDEMGRRVIGEKTAVERITGAGRVFANLPAVRIRKGATEARILAPVSGELLATGTPGEEWLMRIRPDDSAPFAHLLRGREVRPWLSREFEKLQIAMGTGAASLADGGVLVEDLSQVCSPNEWERACADLFLET
jgi:glycine cleavage system H lipoate-binding protein